MDHGVCESRGHHLTLRPLWMCQVSFFTWLTLLSYQQHLIYVVRFSLGYSSFISVTSRFSENLALRLRNLVEGKKKDWGTFLMEAMYFTQPPGKIHAITITFDC
jgi:hypothetical protein